MASVKVGSARSDENRRAYGGRAGDQTGREVSTQDWYLHEKGWRVFRCTDPAKAVKMGDGMQAACDNPHIGYDQWQRHTLYAAAKAVAWAIGKVTKDCETDCSALIRVLLASVGINVPEDFRTGNMPGYLLKTGQFREMTGDKYTRQSAWLKKGDILVTRTNGHTVMVLNDGAKAAADRPLKLGDRDLKKGCEGEDVKQMQLALLAQGYELPKYGADGDFGSETQKAVKAWQVARNMKPTGELTAAECLELAGAGRHIEVTGMAVNVRSAPNLDGRVLGVAARGDALPYQGESRLDGRGVRWYLVSYRNQNGWISEKYGRMT